MVMCFLLPPPLILIYTGLQRAITVTPTPCIGQLSLGSLPPPASLVSVPTMASNTTGTVLSWANGTPYVPLSTIPPVVPSSVLVSSLGTALPEAIPHTPPGFSLSPSLEVFPQKLVDRVRSGQFVDMKDLLTDNISLLHQLETFNNQFHYPSMPGTIRPRLREITSIISWLYCYLAYVAMRTTDPATIHMLAYGRMLIKESQQHQGNGWMEYDKVFRQQAAIDPSRAWNVLHSDIQASTILGRSRSLGGGIYCTLCFESDHRSDQCALNYFQAPPGTPNVSLPTSSGKPRPYPRRRPESALRICVSWNKGRCSFPESCTFRHICAVCHQRHMARDCPSLPEDSEYKRDLRDRPRTSQPQTPGTYRQN